jgi:hypothetical protein
MEQLNYNLGCRSLDELAGRASGPGEPRNSASIGREDETLHELVIRIATEMGVPQFNLGEVAEKVIAIVIPQIEQRVRDELGERRRSEMESYNDSFTG